MADVGTTGLADNKGSEAGRPGGSPSRPPVRVRAGQPGGSGGGFLDRYKPEQGKWTRGCTFAGGLSLVLWGALFLHDRLDVFSGDLWWQLLITEGIPVVFAATLGALAWWVSFTHSKSSDFMIATEGEMKKVSWSTRREVIGSTKVVIIITLMMGFFLFMIDVLFQYLFRWMGVLKS
ncbi:MAG: preprotein translocase subunit SecE [Planctomycetota bacterium]